MHYTPRFTTRKLGWPVAASALILAAFLGALSLTACDSPTKNENDQVNAQAERKKPAQTPANPETPVADPAHPDTAHIIRCGTPDPTDPVVVPVDPVVTPGHGACSEPVPDVAVKCTNESHPVCGCDGKTYVNACQALGIGHVNVAAQGACPIR